jgi:hypothetical protein
MKSIGLSIFLLACYPPEQPLGPINYNTARKPAPVISEQAESSMRKEDLHPSKITDIICSTNDSDCSHGEGGTFCFQALALNTNSNLFEYRTSGNIQSSMFHLYHTGIIYDNVWFQLIHDRISGSMSGDVIDENSYAPEILTVRIHDGKFEVREDSNLNGSCN